MSRRCAARRRGGAEAMAPEAGEGGVARAAGAAERAAGAVRRRRPVARRARRARCGRSPSRPTTWPRSCAATARGSTPSPARLEVVEERLDGYDRLKRKHGGTIAAVLAHAERCRARLRRARAAPRRRSRRRRPSWPRRAAARAARGRAARGAGRRRRRRSPARSASGSPSWRWRARRSPSCSSRATSRGRRAPTRVEFLIAPNPGVPAGAAARDRLGRRAVARDAGAAGRRRTTARRRPTLVFDEVDAGIGGHTARAVGEQLRALAAAARSSASPTCRRSPRWRPVTSRSRSRPSGDAAVTTVTELARRGRRDRAGAHARRRRGGRRAARRHAKELLQGGLGAPARPRDGGRRERLWDRGVACPRRRGEVSRRPGRTGGPGHLVHNCRAVASTRIGGCAVRVGANVHMTSKTTRIAASGVVDDRQQSRRDRLTTSLPQPRTAPPTRFALNARAGRGAQTPRPRRSTYCAPRTRDPGGTLALLAGPAARRRRQRSRSGSSSPRARAIATRASRRWSAGSVATPKRSNRICRWARTVSTLRNGWFGDLVVGGRGHGLAGLPIRPGQLPQDAVHAVRERRPRDDRPAEHRRVAELPPGSGRSASVRSRRARRRGRPAASCRPTARRPRAGGRARGSARR